MSAFRDALRKHGVQCEERFHRAFIWATEEVERSVKMGSEITGSPGQPVDTAALRNSWVAEWVDKWNWRLTTVGFGLNEKTNKIEPVGYARHHEDNVRGVTFRNGGPHSVMITRMGWQQIVDSVGEDVKHWRPEVGSAFTIAPRYQFTSRAGMLPTEFFVTPHTAKGKKT